MNALTSFSLATATPLAAWSQAGADPLASQWAALHEAAGVVRLLGGLKADAPHPGAADYPARIALADSWRHNLARQGIADLVAVMEAGIAALLAAQARGAEPVAAARALWHEFVAARAGLLALLPPSRQSR